VRERVLPVLEDELGPGVAETLARTADQLRLDMEYLDDLAGEVADGLPDPVPLDALAGLPTAVRRRVLRLVTLRAGAPAAELFHEHVLAVDALVTDWHGQKWVDLPGRVRAARRAEALYFEGADS
jgi:tRNA(Ile)-lysidine synthase